MTFLAANGVDLDHFVFGKGFGYAGIGWLFMFWDTLL